MFDDMVSVQLTDNGTNGAVLLPMLQKLHGRPLRVATMCSGTESPILALDMLTKSIEDYIYSHRNSLMVLMSRMMYPFCRLSIFLAARLNHSNKLTSRETFIRHYCFAIFENWGVIRPIPLLVLWWMFLASLVA